MVRTCNLMNADSVVRDDSRYRAITVTVHADVCVTRLRMVQHIGQSFPHDLQRMDFFVGCERAPCQMDIQRDRYRAAMGEFRHGRRQCCAQSLSFNTQPKCGEQFT